MFSLPVCTLMALASFSRMLLSPSFEAKAICSAVTLRWAPVSSSSKCSAASSTNFFSSSKAFFLRLSSASLVIMLIVLFSAW